MVNEFFPDNEYDAADDWNTRLETKQNSTPKPGQLEWFKQTRRPINEIIADLSKEIPRGFLKKLDSSKGGGDYLPWHTCCQLLDRCAPGWEYSIKQVHFSSDRIYLIVAITIPAAEGNFTREATGTEELKRQVWNKDLQIMETKEHAYGDPSSNAEGMALRRAAAKFGLALYLYSKDR